MRGLAVAALFLAGCGAARSRPISPEECQARALAIVANANTCMQAQGQLSELASHNGCAAVLGGRPYVGFCVPGGPP